MASRRRWWTKLDAEARDIGTARDDEIDSLPEDARIALAEIWQKRGWFELRVASAFSAVATDLFEYGGPPEVMEIVGQAVRDEVHHAEISVGLAARYRGGAIQWPAPAKTTLPLFAPAKGSARLALLMIAMCCINETIACAVLEAARSRAKSPLVREALRNILADEVVHARAGWAYVGSPFVTSEMRAILPKWVRRLLSAKLREVVEEHSPLPGEEFPRHGMLSRAATRTVVKATLDDIIFPGLDRVGIDAGPAREWAHDAFKDDAMSPTPADE